MKECFRCKFFDVYYTKGLRSFNKTQLGICKNKLKIGSTQSTCENFTDKPKSDKQKEYLRTQLSCIFAEISELRKLLEAENDNDKDL